MFLQFAVTVFPRTLTDALSQLERKAPSAATLPTERTSVTEVVQMLSFIVDTEMFRKFWTQENAGNVFNPFKPSISRPRYRILTALNS